MVADVRGRPGELVRDFVNTLDVDTGQDQLVSPAALAAWLREHGLATVRAVTQDDLRAAVALRESLRAVLRDHHASAEAAGPAVPARAVGSGAPAGLDELAGPAAPAGLDELMAEYPLQVSLRTGTPELQPAGTGTRAGLGRIVAAVAASHADGTWPRLKVCAESTCEWAFLDTSRNQSRSWCSMSVCGNRAKTKAYRTRHKQPQASRPK